MADKQIRDIRLVFIIFAGIFALFAYKYWPSTTSYVLVSVAVVLTVILPIAPRALTPLFKAWLKLAHALGFVNTRILLTVLYYAVLTPTGLIMRVAGRDPMKRKLDKADGYWERCTIEGLKDRGRYERQF